MGKWCLHAISFIFYRIISKVASNQDRHKSSVEFDFGPNQTTHFGVTCPWVTNISHFWTWISLKPVGQYWSNFMCSVIGVGKTLHKVLRQIEAKHLVSMAAESPHWLIMGEMMSPLFLGCFNPILDILAGNEDLHKISDKFEFRPGRTTVYWVCCPWSLKNIPIDL